MEKFEVVVGLASRCLPHKEGATITAGIEREWRAEEDMSAAIDLVSCNSHNS